MTAVCPPSLSSRTSITSHTDQNRFADLESSLEFVFAVCSPPSAQQLLLVSAPNRRVLASLEAKHLAEFVPVTPVDEKCLVAATLVYVHALKLTTIALAVTLEGGLRPNDQR